MAPRHEAPARRGLAGTELRFLPMERADLTKAGIVFAATSTEGGLGTERQAAAAPPTVSRIAGAASACPPVPAWPAIRRGERTENGNLRRRPRPACQRARRGQGPRAAAVADRAAELLPLYSSVCTPACTVALSMPPAAWSGPLAQARPGRRPLRPASPEAHADRDSQGSWWSEGERRRRPVEALTTGVHQGREFDASSALPRPYARRRADSIVLCDSGDRYSWQRPIVSG